MNSDAQQLEKILLTYFKSPAYTPQDFSGIARGLGIDARKRPALRELLRKWEKSGQVLRLRQARFTLKEPESTAMLGRIRQIKPGKLVFIPNSTAQAQLHHLVQEESNEPVEIGVTPHRDAGAMDGDLVKATLRRSTPAHIRRRSKHRPSAEELRLEVRVDEIVERKRNTWVGIYRPGGRYGTMHGDGRTAPALVMLTAPPPPELLTGMSITVTAQTFPIGKMQATGVVERVLGWPGDAGVDISTIMHRYALRSTFPQAVLDEAESLERSIPEEEIARRENWRQRCVFTIDPATARDYDDAISVRELSNGDIELAVHIADVSYYVRPGSRLDSEAYLRGNSTYLPDRVLPMLPPRLCDDLCSLREGEDKLTRLCLMRYNAEGKLLQTHFANAVICSEARLSYAEALDVLENRASTGKPELDTMLHLGHRLASLLRSKRLQKGALDLNMPEVRVICDDSGTPTGVETERSDIAHSMIEEFMLAANETVALALNAALVPTIYRVHEEPDINKLHTFAQTARSYGIAAGSLNSRKELSRVMEQIKGHEDEQLLTTALLKSLMRARYATRPLGHFGLALGDYCHFTSPIRRYADLVVHRGFNKLVRGKHASIPLPSPSRLAEISEHISETERNSAAAEHEAQQTRLAQYLAAECESEHPHPWLAIITGNYPQGMAVEIPELQMRGFISGGDLSDTLGSRWYFERHAQRWSSADGRSFLPGNTLTVIPVNVDMETRFIDFTPINEQANNSTTA